MEKKIIINIFGSKYTFKTETEANRAQRIAALLESEVAKVESKNENSSGHINQNIVLISVALNIINKYFDLKEQQLELLEILSKRNKKINDILDTSINKPLIEDLK